MRVVLAQCDPKCCETAGEFVTAIDDFVAGAKRAHPDVDLVVFPEALGMWMCLMEPVSLWGRLTSHLLPGGRSHGADVEAAAVSPLWVDGVYRDPDQLMVDLQFCRPSRNHGAAGVVGAMMTSVGDDMLPKKEWYERAFEWVCNRLRLRFLAVSMRSREQFDTYVRAFSTAASKHGVTIQAGSIFIMDGVRVKNVAHVFGPGGQLIARQEKLHPIPFEDLIGITAGTLTETFEVAGVKCGIAICADVNFPNDHVARLYNMGCRFVCCPSGGIIPGSWWSWQFDREVGTAHLARSLETGVVIGRCYNAGDLIPGVLLFQGRSSFTGSRQASPDGSGLIALVDEASLRGECLLGPRGGRLLKQARPGPDHTLQIVQRTSGLRGGFSRGFLGHGQE